MKFRTVKYILKEGISNILANKWMSIASSGVVFTTVFVFGMFFLLAINAGKISNKVEDLPIIAFVYENTDSNTVKDILPKVQAVKGVKKATILTKEQGFDEFKRSFGEDQESLNGLEPKNFLSDGFIINLDKPESAKYVQEQLKNIREIRKMNYEKDTVDKIVKITKIVRLVSYVIIFVLGIVTLFVIVYTIKLTVFARRREINIMKYVGATDWFIRWPFIIEGIIIGVTGAVLATFLITISYSYICGAFGSANVILFEMVPLKGDMIRELTIISALTGGLIGIGGSLFSVRKYLDV